jgi:hypothetical protein
MQTTLNVLLPSAHCAGCGQTFNYEPNHRPAWRGPFVGVACSLKCAKDARDKQQPGLAEAGR